MLTLTSKQHMRALENRLYELESKILPIQHQDAITSNCSDNALPSAASESAPETPNITKTTTTALQPIITPPTQSHMPLPSNPQFEGMLNRIAEMRARSVDITGSFTSILASPFPIHEAELALLSSSVEKIFQEFPLFDNAEFLDRARNQAALGKDTPGHTARWACLNAAIALAVHVKTANSSFEELSPWPWTYFKNAYATFPELILHGNDIESVQAMILMALFARNSADEKMTSQLVSTALRQSQALDPRIYKVNHNENHKDSMESEHARRAVWAAFILGAELSLPCGPGSALDPDEMDIPLPNPGELHLNSTSDVSMFRWRAELAIIQTRVKNRLYTHRALKMPDPALLRTITDLDRELELWRQILPAKVMPGLAHSDQDPAYIASHLTFHHAVSMVHWARRRHPGIPGQLDMSRLKDRTAAQNILHVLQALPPEQFAQFWYESPHLLSAINPSPTC